ncbi:MAG TPA: fumarylacetoacetate hydrolase family protein [Gemmatales bacterium]|nr:fumarylacetoacetate hydrolase family protein [Gemmatales bacterium]
MQLAQVRYNGRKRVGVVSGDELQLLPRPRQGGQRLHEILHGKNPLRVVKKLLKKSKSVNQKDVSWLPPIYRQEVWAAGVTYKRSMTGRKQESKGAAKFYDDVYKAERPEIFFKATPHRVVGHQQAIRIRGDSDWNVPEPELTLVLNPDLQLIGYTIGNDVSSRSIEGENPLYLPQAKNYLQCAAIGPVITLADDGMQPSAWNVKLDIFRLGKNVFTGSTSVGGMARTLGDLVSWLGRDNAFPDGCFFMTGTGIVPEKEFTLLPGDMVEIEIDGLGKLVNPVVQGVPVIEPQSSTVSSHDDDESKD